MKKNEDLSNCIVEEIYVDSLTNFRNALRQCCLDMDINQIQAGALLRILKSYRCFRQLPKSSRALLKTGRSKINFVPLGQGVYWHIGFVRI